MRALFTACCLLLSGSSQATSAQETPLPQHPDEIVVPALESFSPPPPRVTELEGGTRLLLLEDHALPLVDGSLVLMAGSVREGQEQAGLTELLAEVLREGGSEAHSGEELDQWLDSHGAELRVESSEEVFAIHFSCLAEDTGTVLGLALELLTQPAYPGEQVERSRQRLLTALERRDDEMEAIADRELVRVIYGDSCPYARQPSERSLKRIGREDLLAYHHRHFGKDRLHIGVSGDTNLEKILEVLEPGLEALPAVGPPEEVLAPSFIQPARTTIYLYDRPGVPQTELRLAAPGVRRADESYSALSLWSHVIGIGGMTNRLMLRVRTELGLAYSVGAWYRGEWARPGRLEAWCSTRNDGVGAALEAMTEVLRSGLEPIPAEELEATRARALNAEVFGLDSQSERLGRALALDFRDYPADFWSKHRQALRRLGAEEVLAAAKAQLDPDRLVVLVVGPAEELEQQLTELAKRAELGEVKRLEPWRDPQLVAVDRARARLLAAIGGEELWSGSRCVDYTAELTTPNLPPVELRVQRHLAGLKSRIDRGAGAGAMIVIINDERAGVLSGGTLTPYGGKGLQRLQAGNRNEIFALLHALSATPAEELALEGSRLSFESGELTGSWVELDEQGRPTRTGYEAPSDGYRPAGPVSFLLEEWEEVEGRTLPTRITKSPDGWVRRITQIRFLEGLDPALFELP